VLPGFSGLTAPIGIAEKGYLSLKFTVNAAGGHSSTPGPETAIGILARAIDRLQSNPFPYRLKAAMPMFKALTPVASPLLKVAFANTWLLGGFIERKLAASPETAASIHTTVAPTIFHSGVKDNVLPGLAEAVVNFRILPGETIAEVSDRVNSVINDERVSFEALRENAWEPSPVSPVDSTAYRHMVSVTSELFPGVTCAPTNMLGATDSRHFYALSPQVYRFTPITALPEDLDRIHGINERISITDMAKMVEFFYRLIQRWSSAEM
jgi:carboxypeptidase PM20D1